MKGTQMVSFVQDVSRAARLAIFGATFFLCGCIALAEPEDFDIRPANPEQIARERAASTNFRENNWARFDRDGDDALNLQEWRALWWRYHLIWDADGSGDFDLNEWVHRECGAFSSSGLYRNCSRAALREFLTTTGSREGRVSERHLHRSSDRFFRMNDDNNDGVVTRAEASNS